MTNLATALTCRCRSCLRPLRVRALHRSRSGQPHPQVRRVRRRGVGLGNGTGLAPGLRQRTCSLVPSPAVPCRVPAILLRLLHSSRLGRSALFSERPLLRTPHRISSRWAVLELACSGTSLLRGCATAKGWLLLLPPPVIHLRQELFIVPAPSFPSLRLDVDARPRPSHRPHSDLFHLRLASLRPSTAPSASPANPAISIPVSFPTRRSPRSSSCLFLIVYTFAL